jgi:hypothetical protein
MLCPDWSKERHVISVQPAYCSLQNGENRMKFKAQILVRISFSFRGYKKKNQLLNLLFRIIDQRPLPTIVTLYLLF